MTVIRPASRQIPGMIEPAEQDLLTDLASSIALDRGDIVCEFGCYLGRSSHCIVDGLNANGSLAAARSARPVFHAFDVFECSEDGLLGAYLVADTRRVGIEQLLRKSEGRIDFQPAFDHFMRDIDPGLMQVHRTTLQAARHPGGKIAAMHLDAPKWFLEYRQVLAEFGPHLKPGAEVVFQDFFYHWSAELIAAVEVFMQRGCFEPLETAASSLLVRVHEPIDDESMRALDQAMADYRTEELVESALNRLSGFEVERAPIFLSRLYLAALQWTFERGEHARAAEWLRRLQKRFTGGLPAPVVADLADLLRHGFSLRSIYESDTVSESDLHARR